MGGTKQAQKVHLPFTDSELALLKHFVLFQKRMINTELALEMYAAGHVQRPVSSLRRKAVKEKWTH